MSASEAFLYVTAQTVLRHLAAISAGFADGSIPVAKLATLTGDRVVGTTAGGVLTALAAFTSSAIVIGDASGKITSAPVITASRALISDVNGVPTHSTLTSANLANVAHTVSDTARIDLTLSSGTLSADIVANSIGVAQLVAQAGCNFTGSTTGGALQAISSSLQNYASVTYTPRSSSSRIGLIGYAYHASGGGLTSTALRRGSTLLVGADYGVSTGLVLSTVDSGHGGSSTTWNFSASNPGSVGTISYAVLAIVDA